MKRILQSFKDLYKGEDVAKRHLWYAFLMVLPALLGAMRYFLDKDTPKEILLIALIVFFILTIINIIPYFFTLGLWIDFLKDRLEGILGIPKITSGTLKKGLAFFPLTFVWNIYFGLIFILLFVLPLVVLITQLIGNKHPDTLMVIGGILLMILLFFITLAVIFIFAPFYNYVAIKYVKLGHYTPDMFNPFVLIGYMKKAFGATMMVMLKMIAASLIVNTLAGFFTGVIYLIIIAIVGFSVVVDEGNADTAMYTPGVILSVVPLATICGIIQAYVTGMVGFAAADNYLDVYKNEIEPYEE